MPKWSTFQRMYEEALSVSDMVGLCVGTRPDCVPDAVLDLLAGYQARGYGVRCGWSSGCKRQRQDVATHQSTGPQLPPMLTPLPEAHLRGIKVCAHLIVGLPGERRWTAWKPSTVSWRPASGIKLHPLHVVEGTLARRGRRDGWMC